MNKMCKTTFLRSKDFKYKSMFSLISLECLDLFIFVTLCQQHSSWHMDLLRIHFLMNWTEKDKFRKKNQNMRKNRK